MTKFKLEEFLPYNMVLATDKLVNSVYNVYKKHNIDIPQWRIIVYLGDKKTAPAQEIKNLSKIDKSTFTRACVALEDKGLIKRKINEADNRHKNLIITVKGQKTYDKIINDVNKWYDKLKSDIGESEIKKMNKATQNINKKL